MAASALLHLLLLLPLFAATFSLSTANLHTNRLLNAVLISDVPASHGVHNTTNASPTRYFEVDRPIKLPDTKPCSYLILKHDFAYTYGKPPVLANYTPPSDCYSRRFAKIVLEWTSTCKGLQYDRIFGVWLGGVELLRSCTAEPRASGIVWSVKKDITRYSCLLMKNNTLAVYLGNIVDSTYTGVYHAEIKFHFYPPDDSGLSLADGESNLGNSVPGYGSPADLILPISRNPPLNDGLWFEIENATDIESKKFSIPLNVYRAVLEVYVSFHGDDEFWYANLPNEYIEANNLTGTAGNGPFREVLVSLDGEIVGSVWPFTVVYTGGIDPLFWRPITGIGSFDLPTYDIEITPFLAKILDGKVHEFGFGVTNALDVWYIDANLHLWLDHKRPKTEGILLSYNSVPLNLSSVLDFKGLDGKFLIGASRSISATGWVGSSYGIVMTSSKQQFSFSNMMVMGNDGNLQIINQLIHSNVSVDAITPSLSLISIQTHRQFPLYLYSNYVDQGSTTYLFVANLTFAFNEQNYKTSGVHFSISSLKNVQRAQGSMVVQNDSVVSGLGSTQQVYKYSSSELCYFRNVSSTNYIILYDEVGKKCQKRAESHPGIRLNQLSRFPGRSSYLI